MFTNLTERLSKTIKNISGRGRLTDDNIKDSLREIRKTLIEADVAISVIKPFISQVRQRAIGQEVKANLNPGQAMVKVVQDELTKMMGDKCEKLDLQTQPPAIILMAGLQGSGKTTSVAKLSRYLAEQENKKVMVVSTDIYRPAAIEQLETLASEVNAEFFPSNVNEDPVNIAQAALTKAKTQFIDVLIVDTAGRLHIDDEMMDEIKQLHQALSPTETLFVVDSMTGQDAANTAKAFHQALPLTGVILTKTDGDARGGAALSIRAITEKPIKFLGIGEKTEALETFHPDRLASRILGMGDMLSLIEEAERKIDKKKADKLAKKIKKGKGFDLEDFQSQLQQMGNMGGIGKLMDKIPGLPGIPDVTKDKVNDKSFTQMDAIVNSMTVRERRFPDIIKGSRKRRIAMGSGTTIQEVNRMLKQFGQMQKMMKKASKPGGMKKMMRNFSNMMPPGSFPGV